MPFDRDQIEARLALNLIASAEPPARQVRPSAVAPAVWGPWQCRDVSTVKVQPEMSHRRFLQGRCVACMMYITPRERNGRPSCEKYEAEGANSTDKITVRFDPVTGKHVAEHENYTFTVRHRSASEAQAELEAMIGPLRGGTTGAGG